MCERGDGEGAGERGGVSVTPSRSRYVHASGGHLKITVGFPPNIEEIEKLVPGVKEMSGVLFAWADTVFNPSGIEIPEWLVEHEQVHLNRQSGDPATWWHRYLTDGAFRLAEELPAHRVEWKAFKRRVKNREVRACYLASISARLAGPLYGRLLTTAAAKAKITAA